MRLDLSKWIFRKPGSRRGLWMAALLAGLVIVGSGFTRQAREKGSSAQNANLQLFEPKCLSIVVALHPRCPCARATIGELVRIYNRVPEEVKITVLAYTPEDDAEVWSRTAMLGRLEYLHARVISDLNGEIARRVGVGTSGQTIVFSPNGKQLYNGGLTDGCSNIGKSAGEEMVMQIIYGSAFRPENFPAFGTSLFPVDAERAEMKFAKR